jgi:hypothetical protein
MSNRVDYSLRDYDDDNDDLHTFGSRILVVKQNAVERTVHAIVDIVHILGMVITTFTMNTVSITANSTASNNVSANGECRGNIVAARLSNNANVSREHLVNCGTKDSSYFFKSNAILDISSRETTANIKQGEIETKFLSFIKHFASTIDSIGKSIFVEATATNMEAAKK